MATHISAIKRAKQNEKRRLRMALYCDPVNQQIYNRLKQMGEIPGPSLKLIPEELQATATANPG